jgi:hypothetical protein
LDGTNKATATNAQVIIIGLISMVAFTLPRLPYGPMKAAGF